MTRIFSVSPRGESAYRQEPVTHLLRRGSTPAPVGHGRGVHELITVIIGKPCVVQQQPVLDTVLEPHRAVLGHIVVHSLAQHDGISGHGTLSVLNLVTSTFA